MKRLSVQEICTVCKMHACISLRSVSFTSNSHEYM